MTDMTDATPTIAEMPEMRPSAEERIKAAWADKSGDPPSMRELMEACYRDGYTAALSSLSPLIKAARQENLAKVPDDEIYRLRDEASEDDDVPVNARTLHAMCVELEIRRYDAAKLRRALSTFPAPDSPSRPAAWLKWAHSTFGDVALDPKERTLRFIEEAIELVHAMGLSAATVITTADRVYGRDRGNIAREIGQAQACLECLSEAIGINADQEAGREFQRIQLIPQEEWDRRRSAKVKLGIALPAPPTTSDGGEG